MAHRVQGFRHLKSKSDQGRKDSRPVDPNGSLVAYMTLAHDLFTVADNGHLDELLVQRLRDPIQYQGARHELFAEATCLRGGFEIEREDEKDRSRRHAEFTAVHKRSGQQVSVEAKSKHWAGFLGQPGERTQKFRLKFGRLLNDAFDKNPAHPLVVFLDTGLPSELADRFYFDPKEASEIKGPVSRLIKRIRDRHSGQDPYILLVFTNQPNQFSPLNEVAPERRLLAFTSKTGLLSTSLTEAAQDIAQAALVHGNIPDKFPAST